MNAVVAVATNTLGARSETFVSRHIETLNGGRTVAICRRVEDRSVTDHPVLVIGGPGGTPAVRVGNLIRAVWNQLYQGGIAVPNARTDGAIARFLAEQEAGCVLAEFGPLGCIMQRAAAQVRIPLYVYFRGRDATSLLANRGVRRAYGRLFPEMAGVIAVSSFLLDKLSSQGFSHPNMHVIPSGVDTALFVPGPKDPGQLLSVGRFVAKKAPDLVIRAFARIAGRYPVRLDMIGDGPLLAECRRLAVSLGVDERIRFLGAQPPETVRRQMAGAYALLQHSVTGPGGETEGLPTVIQEAMAAGAVVVATRHAGIPEAIESGRNGLLVAERDLDGYVEAIEQIIGDPISAAAMAAQARRDAVEYFDAGMLRHRLEAVILAGR
jgi:glycosyltransferase involved in cell wall biosynthesis